MTTCGNLTPAQFFCAMANTGRVCVSGSGTASEASNAAP